MNKVAAFDGVVYQLGKARAGTRETCSKNSRGIRGRAEPVGGQSRRVNGNEIPSGGSAIEGVWAEMNKRAKPV